MEPAYSSLVEAMTSLAKTTRKLWAKNGCRLGITSYVSRRPRVPVVRPRHGATARPDRCRKRAVTGLDDAFQSFGPQPRQIGGLFGALEDEALVVVEHAQRPGGSIPPVLGADQQHRNLRRRRGPEQQICRLLHHGFLSAGQCRVLEVRVLQIDHQHRSFHALRLQPAVIASILSGVLCSLGLDAPAGTGCGVKYRPKGRHPCMRSGSMRPTVRRQLGLPVALVPLWCRQKGAGRPCCQRSGGTVAPWVRATHGYAGPDA